ncbi:AAA family ATPase [Planomonospora corallina]|uniref:AAA family ATPase n=1 Tax=Planomonospora corallina TaxID=1806052 RepID=A0ABV8IDC7_9ACTN
MTTPAQASTPAALDAAQMLSALTEADFFATTLPDALAATASRPASPRPLVRPGALTPVGERARPNGQVYKPRQVGPHEDLALLREAQRRRQHVLLYGPPGTGKTALIEAAFASYDGPGLETVVGSADLTETDLLGTFVQDPATRAYVWAPGPLHRSVECDVPGARLSEALKSRFIHHLLVGTDWALARGLGVDGKVVTVAENLEWRRTKGEITWSPQLRELLAFRDLAAVYGEAYAASALAAAAPEHDRDEIVTALRKVFPDTVAARVEGRCGA